MSTDTPKDSAATTMAATATLKARKDDCADSDLNRSIASFDSSKSERIDSTSEHVFADRSSIFDTSDRIDDTSDAMEEHDPSTDSTCACSASSRSRRHLEDSNSASKRSFDKSISASELSFISAASLVVAIIALVVSIVTLIVRIAGAWA